MENEKLEEFREILLQKQSKLENAAGRNKEQLGQQLNASESAEEVHVDFNHPADMVGGDPDYEKELNLLKQERDELSAVGEALDRIASGSYGTCEECEGEIPYERLKAIPYTKYCVRCQEMLDRSA